MCSRSLLWSCAAAAALDLFLRHKIERCFVLFFCCSLLFLSFLKTRVSKLVTFSSPLYLRLAAGDGDIGGGVTLSVSLEEKKTGDDNLRNLHLWLPQLLLLLMD